MSEFATELTDLVHRMAESGDIDRWPELQDLGLVGIGIAEQAGGSGGSLGDLLVAIRQLACAGIASPIVEASTALYAVGPSPGFDTIACTHADLSSGSVTVDLGAVAYADAADRIVVIGTHEVGVIAGRAGVTMLAGSDIAGAPAACVELAAAAVHLQDGGPGAEAVTARLALARSAALLGGATAAYELTRGYVTDRQQFGSPLISIPAVSAALAQMAVRLRTTQSGIDRAVEVFDDDTATAQRCFAAAASARITAAETATHIARTAHQLHGAVGITGEYGLHRHTRALWAWRDADLAERAWSEQLGDLARTAGEAAFWDEITA